MWDLLLLDLNAATMQQSTDVNDSDSAGSGYGLIENAAIGVKDRRIVWCGGRDQLDARPEQLAVETISMNGALATPGLVDCHTHLVYAGNRAGEFESRLNGISYAQIAAAGGGIVSTVQQTRAASEDALYAASIKRLQTLMRGGVTSVEIKSGYGLDTETELKMLRVARRLGADCGVRVRTSFLGAHALPLEYADRSDDYIALVCEEMIPAVVESKLADAVDAFCENIAFSADQIERVFIAAADHDLPVKIHAEQLSNQRGAALAARYRALSADHLEYLEAEDVELLAKAGTIPVLLPGAFYFLRETQQPPLAAMRRAKLNVALASDANPGSSPVLSLLLVMNMACTLFNMTPQEALGGVTCFGAKALGIDDETGTLAPGKAADIALWDVSEPAELAYRIGDNPLLATVNNGVYRTLNRGFA